MGSLGTGLAEGIQPPFILSGGVELRAMAIRLNAGDVSALRDAVCLTPGPTQTRLRGPFSLTSGSFQRAQTLLTSCSWGRY